MSTTIYSKLARAREIVHGKKLTKTGRNAFAGFNYFELSDFLPHALDAFSSVGLVGVVDFHRNDGSSLSSCGASLRVVDLESGEGITFHSPATEAALKGCHAVQNLGAVQTYQRRYLWVAALELIENDAVDASEPKQPDAPVQPKQQADRPRETSAPQSKSGLPSRGPTGKEQVWLARIVDSEIRSSAEGAAKKWTCFSLRFEGGKVASTFDSGLVDGVSIGDMVTVKVKPSAKPGYWDIVEINRVPEEKNEK